MWLTIATFVGYAIVYTIWLKPATPQNIVIGGASGAMPPVLGWAAVTNELTAPAWILFLIIFVWTPPHFWALALYRLEDYRRSGLPMLPVTHGPLFTRLNILLYSVLLAAVNLCGLNRSPFAVFLPDQCFPYQLTTVVFACAIEVDSKKQPRTRENSFMSTSLSQDLLRSEWKI